MQHTRLLQRARSGRLGRSGAVTVEFALVVPIVFTLFFGSIEMCWLNMMRNCVANAAYESARKSAIPGTDDAEARAVAMETLAPLRMQNGLQFTRTDLGSEVEVTISVPVAPNAWGLTRYTGNLTINRSVRLTKE